MLKKTSSLHKELKIRGQIGECGQRDKLSFVRLLRQTTKTKSAGYNEDDIVNIVIRAIAPSLTLRNVLETTHNLTLKKLMLLTEVHYEERNATDLCSKLAPLNQLPEKTAYSFVMRCIELRQVLLAALKSDVKDHKALVLKLFFKTLESL